MSEREKAIVAKVCGGLNDLPDRATEAINYGASCYLMGRSDGIAEGKRMAEKETEEDGA